MSNARAIFEEFANGGLVAIHSAVTSKREETLYLDFKEAATGSGPLQTPDRCNLAKALSGFANSEGGVIVWGVEAQSMSKDDPDVAGRLVPISKLKLFLSDLQKATAEVVSPGVIGAEHEIFEETNGSDTGYVISYIPQGTGEPHMARAKDQHRYYYRSGSSFLKMESFMLADRFGRRPQPKLEIACHATSEPSFSGGKTVLRLRLGIRNTGGAIALHPAMEAKRSLFEHDEFGLDGNRKFGLMVMEMNKQGNCFFAGGTVIYPSRTLMVTRFKIEMEGRDILEHSFRQPVKIPYSLYCDGFSVSSELRFNMESLIMTVYNSQGIEHDLFAEKQLHPVENVIL
jgi:hypothetical protein